MTAFEVPIYPEEPPSIGIPVTYTCSLGADCTRRLTCKGLHTIDAVSAYPPKLAANALYGKRGQAIVEVEESHMNLFCIEPECTCGLPKRERPTTGTGDAPMKELVIDLPTPNPETVADYMAWVKFRTESLNRWIKMDAPETASLILETIARVEGDLQQIRHLIKAEKDTTDRVDDILSHLTAFSIEALDKIMDANGERE